jgi:hypothetical protein
MWKLAIITPLVSTTLVLIGHALASEIDSAHKFAWSENVGWTNWQHDSPNSGDGVFVDESFLSGFAWAENVGWINFGDGTPGDGVHYANSNGFDFGVNRDSESGDLLGLAWSENVGWINFDTEILGSKRARFDECEHRFFGYAWAENIGWINLNDATHFVAVGPCVAGDLDCDGDVALEDLSVFASSMNGPDVSATCGAFDSDGDDDVDLVDFAEVQRQFVLP